MIVDLIGMVIEIVVATLVQHMEHRREWEDMAVLTIGSRILSIRIRVIPLIWM